MKLKLLLFFLFVITVSNAQITDLQKLSKGKFYSYDEIKDENNNLKGYLFLYEIDKIAKETFELEYIILDENLNKVANGFFTEMKYESFFKNAKRIDVSVSFNKNKLLLKLSDYVPGGPSSFLRYRLLDLSTNKMSDPFKYNSSKLLLNPLLNRNFDDRNGEEQASDQIYNLKNVGLVVNTGVKIVSIDDNFNEKWKSDFYDGFMYYQNSDSDVIVYLCRNFEGLEGYSQKKETSITVYDTKTGRTITNFILPDLDKLSYNIVDVELTQNEIILMGNFSKNHEDGFIDDKKGKGLFKYVLNKSDGKLIDSKYLNWTDTTDKLNINKNGEIKKEGFVFTHKMLTLGNGKIIVACEAFKTVPMTTNNLYFLELSKDFTLDNVFEVSKFKSKHKGFEDHSIDMKKYGYFDFVDYQSLGDDEFLFYFYDNLSNTSLGSKDERFESGVYGVVSYSEGKFKRQTIKLKSEEGTMRVYPAKKGYVMFIEDLDEKPSKIRLEKINY